MRARWWLILLAVLALFLLLATWVLGRVAGPAPRSAGPTQPAIVHTPTPTPLVLQAEDLGVQVTIPATWQAALIRSAQNRYEWLLWQDVGDDPDEDDYLDETPMPLLTPFLMAKEDEPENALVLPLLGLAPTTPRVHLIVQYAPRLAQSPTLIYDLLDHIMPPRVEEIAIGTVETMPTRHGPALRVDFRYRTPQGPRLQGRLVTLVQGSVVVLAYALAPDAETAPSTTPTAGPFSLPEAGPEVFSWLPLILQNLTIREPVQTPPTPES